MSEARKTFPMSTFVSYIKGGESNNSVQELLGYMTQKDIDAEFEPFAAALAKAWIYEQHPELAKMKNWSGYRPWRQRFRWRTSRRRYDSGRRYLRKAR